jgi:hypothetical protein
LERRIFIDWFSRAFTRSVFESDQNTLPYLIEGRKKSLTEKDA